MDIWDKSEEIFTDVVIKADVCFFANFTKFRFDVHFMTLTVPLRISILDPTHWAPTVTFHLGRGIPSGRMERAALRSSCSRPSLDR
jgi:hypothetical protein